MNHGNKTLCCGKAQMKDGTPSTIYRFRLDAAYDYLIKNPDTTSLYPAGKGRMRLSVKETGERTILFQ